MTRFQPMPRGSRFAVALAWLLATVTAAPAQSWPEKPLRVIVPVTAGSAVDIIARTVSEGLAERLGQPVVVENRTGAGGTIGAAFVAKSDPDGYTILMHSAAHVIAGSTFANLPYDPGRDFAGITPLANVPLVLVVSPAKYRTLADLVAAAKAHPGAINYATVGAGAAAHLTAVRFLLSAGLEAQQIPFKGAPEAVTEVMTGRVDFFFAPTMTVLPLIAGGKIGALAVSSAQRASALPDVPTLRDAGFANADYDFWVGMFVPAKTPRAIVERLNRETVAVLGREDVRKRLALLGGEPMTMTPETFDAYVKEKIELNARLVQAAGIKPE
jgi:tripartite-type tricarboxylate transporter receptor subunit TctC